MDKKDITRINGAGILTRINGAGILFISQLDLLRTDTSLYFLKFCTRIP